MKSAWIAAACLATAFQALPGTATAADASGPVALKARYAELADQLARNDFQRPLFVDSAQAGDALSGEVYAVLNHPYATVSNALGTPAQWCDVLILPFNTKYCKVKTVQGQPVLAMRVGRKFDQPLKDAYPLDFSWRKLMSGSEYFEARMSAANGPMGTHDYRIQVAAVPLDSGRTFLHLSYAYGYGFAGKLAMQGYLATVGADKVGFTVTGRDSKGQPRYIDGVRGVVERNAMRYYLAIDAYLDALAAPPALQMERRIQSWFTATERYARQLREMDRATYVALKRSEYERQQTVMQTAVQ